MVCLLLFRYYMLSSFCQHLQLKVHATQPFAAQTASAVRFIIKLCAHACLPIWEYHQHADQSVYRIQNALKIKLA